MKTRMNRMKQYIFIGLVLITSFFAFNTNVSASAKKVTLGPSKTDYGSFLVNDKGPFYKYTLNARNISCTGLPAGVTVDLVVDNSDTNTSHPKMKIGFHNATGTVTAGTYKGTCSWTADQKKDKPYDFEKPSVTGSIDYELTVESGANQWGEVPPNNTGGGNNSGGNNSSTGTVDFLGINGAPVNSNGFEKCSGGSNGLTCRFQYNKTYSMPQLGRHSQYGDFKGWALASVSKYCSEVQQYGSADLSSPNFTVSSEKSDANFKFHAIFEKSCDASSSSGGGVNYTIPGTGSGTGTGGSTAPTIDAFSGTEFIEVPGVCNTFKVSVEKSGYSRYQFDGVSHNVNLFQATDNCNSNQYYAFCYDPNKKSPGGGSTYNIQGVVNPFDDEPAFNLPAEQSKAFEGFVYYIYQKYAPQDGNLDEQTRAAIQMAMRVYWTNQGGNFGSNAYTKGYYALAVRWTCEFNGDSACPQASGLASVTFADSSLEALTKSIYLEAMGAANTCLAGGGCSGLQQKVGVEWSVPDDKVECETEGGLLVKKITGKVTGLATYMTSYKLQEMICPSGLTCELYINNGLVNVGTDLKGMADGTYMIKVKGTNAAFTNASGKIGMKIKTESTEDFHNILAIKPVSGSLQRMVIFLKGDENEYDIELMDVSALTCDGGCNISPELNPNMPETFNKEKYIQMCCSDPSANPEYCPQDDDSKKCVQIIWNIVCGTDGEVYSIKEGFHKDEGKINYERCVINKKDAAGNSYVANGSGGGMPRSGNRYCTVSCKEDWEFEMPGYLGQHDAGRYFLLNLNRVQGTRTCVTGSPKGKSGKNVTEILNDYDLQESFQKDLERVDAEIISALNRLAEARAYVYRWDKGHSAGTQTESVECGGGSLITCTGNALASGTVPKLGPIKKSVDKWQLTGPVTYHQFSIVRKASYNTNGKVINTIVISDPKQVKTTKECKNGSTCGYLTVHEGNECNNSCSIDVVKAEDDYGIAAWRAQEAEAKSTLDQKLAERKEMIADIKECSNWANNYHFEPEITYTYAENDYMNMVGGNNQFRITGGGNPSASVIEESFRDEASKPDSYDATGATGGKGTYLNTENIFNVDTSSPQGQFKVTENKVSDIPYNSSIKIVSQAKYSYEIKGTWYTIHDSGAMQYEDGPDTGYADPIKGDTTLVGETGKIMPISINTPSGQYEYQLRFTDVGQYNDSNDASVGADNLGRLIGGDDANHSGRNSVFNGMSYLQPEIGQTYLCYYDVVDHNKCATKVKTEIVSLLDCPNAYNCPGYSSGGAYLDPNGDVSFFIREISLNDMNPTGRPLGKNWSDEEGAAAMAAIESAGDEIFAKDPEYSFTFTPTGMASVRAMAQSTNYGGFELSCDEKGDNCTNGWLENLKDVAGVTVNQFRS